MAQGFLSPTKTGSFGEALGNVAGALGSAQQQEEKRAIENARIKAELASNELAQFRKTQALKSFAGALGPSASAQPSGDEGAPADGSTISVGGQRFPAQFANLTPERAMQLSIQDPEIGKLAMDYIKMVNEQKKLAMEGVKPTERGTFIVDVTKPTGGTFVPHGGRPTVERFLPGVGNLSLPEGDVIKFDNVVDALSRDPSNQDAQKELDRLVRKARGTAGASPTGPQTPAQAELAKKAAEITSEQRAKDDNERYKEFVNKGVMAGPRKARLKTLEQIALSPNANQDLGVFEGPELSAQLGALLESSGKGLPKIDEIRKIFTNLGLDKKVKAEQLFAQQQIALVNLEIRKISRAPGEGAQSDLENRLALAAGLDQSDTPAGFLKKVRFLKEQADFEREVAKKLKESKMGVEDFMFSNDYQGLLVKYENRLSQILGLSPRASQPARRAAPAAQSYNPASQKLREQLGIR